MAFQETKTLSHKLLSFNDLQINNLVLVGSYHCKNSRKKIELHNHEAIFEIIYFNTGYQTYCVGEKTYQIKGGDILVILPNEYHGTGNNFQGKGIIYWIQFKLSLIGGAFLNIQGEEASVFIDTLLNLKSRHFSVNNSFKKYLDDLFEIGTKEASPLNRIKIYSIATQILLEIEKSSTTPDKDKSTKGMSDIVKYINENLGKDLFIDDLAIKLGISTSRFIGKFKKEVGTTPSDYIQRQRINYSKELLLKSNSNITKIAFALQFPSSQHFSTIFKKYTGVTPSDFRKNTPN